LKNMDVAISIACGHLRYKSKLFIVLAPCYSSELELLVVLYSSVAIGS
jgi:hypothetical protein